ncbi:MAG TPA: cupin domain-containing protein [Devosiaceae bacterium]|nr:cupin domain-containing protein [Devosiaceae bacterium]
MTTNRSMPAAALSAASDLGSSAAWAESSGLKRTNLQEHDLSVPGREVIQDLIGFDPGAVGPMHSHPGEEIVYVAEGTLEYQLRGQPPVTLKAGEVLFIPAGTVHGVKNTGSGNATELATYFIEKGRPFVTLAN